MPVSDTRFCLNESSTVVFPFTVRVIVLNTSPKLICIVTAHAPSDWNRMSVTSAPLTNPAIVFTGHCGNWELLPVGAAR